MDKHQHSRKDNDNIAVDTKCISCNKIVKLLASEYKDGEFVCPECNTINPVVKPYSKYYEHISGPFTKENLIGFHSFLKKWIMRIGPFNKTDKKLKRTIVNELMKAITPREVAEIIQKYNPAYGINKTWDVAEKLIYAKGHLNSKGEDPVWKNQGVVYSTIGTAIVIFTAIVISSITDNYDWAFWSLAFSGTIARSIWKNVYQSSDEYSFPFDSDDDSSKDGSTVSIFEAQKQRFIYNYCSVCKYYDLNKFFCRKIDQVINEESYKECSVQYFKIRDEEEYKVRNNVDEITELISKLPPNLSRNYFCHRCKTEVEIDDYEVINKSYICPKCETLNHILLKTNKNIIK